MPKVRWKDNPKLYMHQYYLENKEKHDARSREWARLHPEKTVAATRKWKFGLTIEQQKEILSGLCGICKARRATHIDHDHNTCEVRGGLCNNCNTGLGMFRDDITVLKRALAYLRKHVKGRKK